MTTLSLSDVVSTTHIEAPALTVILYFPWNSTGYANELGVTEIAQTVKHDYPGYTPTRARTTRMQKKFALQWNAMTNGQWLSFIKFWRTVRGGAGEFYFEFPVNLYGTGTFGGINGEEPDDGFDAEANTQYGNGPMFLVKFESDELPQGFRLEAFEGWIVSANMIEVA